jgi:RNA-binding protein 25
MGALAHQQQMMHHQQFPPPSKVVPVFIGSISGGISDAFLNDLLSVSALRSSTERLLKFPPRE